MYETISRSGWNKNDIRKRIQEATAKPLRELIRSKECGEGMSPESAEDDWDRMLPKFQNEKTPPPRLWVSPLPWAPLLQCQNSDQIHVSANY